MGNRSTNYTKDFRLESIKLVVEVGRPGKDVAWELGINISTLYNWISECQKYGSSAFPGKGHLMPHDDKVRRLEKELREVTMERDILKKAMAVFSRDQK